MEEIFKHINDTNASYRSMEAGNAKNTDLFLDNEHFGFFQNCGDEITVRFNKENLTKAILFIASILPRKYDNSSTHNTVLFSNSFVYDQLLFLDAFFKEDGHSVDFRTQKWILRKDVPKKNGKIDKRFFFNGLLEEVIYTNSKGERIKDNFTIRNYLAGGYSDLHIKKSENNIFDVWITNTNNSFDDGKERGYELDDNDSFLSRQYIFYGAPGTGKSHTIKDKTEIAEKEDRLVRTTFHPDSDYSTFVGAYKPTMKCSEKIYTLSELKAKLKEVKESGVTYPCHKFAAKYWESLKNLSVDAIKEILYFSDFTDSMTVEISKGVAIGQDLLNNRSEEKIIYEFVPQAFTKAYVKAWNTKDDIYLVIEEINRGNCAQIFGDLFQLLDRKDGRSKYPVDSDTDLEKFLSDALASSNRDDFPEGVREGKKLVLPENLYIWATMNTSDQSLFPIDSAFKRRWDWKYMKIRNYPEKDYKIIIGEEKRDWWGFIKKINEIIASMTSSADKQLGYFFCTAENGEIDERLFVSKVIFYLWNDVFKDYGFEDASLFQFTEIGEDGKEVTKDLTFPDFYDEEGEKVNIDRLKDFLQKVDNWKKTNEENS